MGKTVFFLLLCFSLGLKAQAYPQGYFRNPLKIPILLAGNFGECRPGHFHSGIDIKTQARENLPVHAAAAGYISRIKTEAGGFGHAIYITHPNGLTTLYAHLNDFFPALQALLRSEQYKRRSWRVDLSLSPDRFPVQQGQFIAYSGNTGGSTAPHLHFEIRDSKTEHPLNPMLFGLPIADHRPPQPYQLALYDLSKSVYEQQPLILPLKLQGKVYVPVQDTLILTPRKLGIGIYVQDYMEGSANTLSFYTAEWSRNGVLQGRLTLDDIGYDETRYLNACADYRLKRLSGNWFNSCFLLPENRLERLYTQLANERGMLLPDTRAEQQLSLQLQDASGNTSVVQCRVQARGTDSFPTPCERFFKAGLPAVLEHPNVRFLLPAGTLYDDICFRFATTYDTTAFSAWYQLHNADVPVHRYFDLSLKPDKPVPFALTNRMVLQYDDGRSKSGRAATARDGWYTAQVRALGSYRLLADTIAPQIRPLSANGAVLSGKKALYVEVTDNLTSVRNFTASLDGQWLCFEQHGDQWFYRFDKYCPPGRHTLELSAEDENGNERRMRYTFTR